MDRLRRYAAIVALESALLSVAQMAQATVSARGRALPNVEV